MENSEVNALIDAFVGYREMLVPIQADMHEFLETYGALRNDVDKLNSAFSGDVQARLSEIYKNLASQAENLRVSIEGPPRGAGQNGVSSFHHRRHPCGRNQEIRGSHHH